MLGFRMDFVLADSHAEKFIHFDFRNIQTHLLIIKTRQLQQITHQKCHTVCFAVNDAKELLCNLRILHSTVQKGFRIAFYGCQRCSQLMRHIRHKFLSHIVQLFLLCDILQNNNHAFNLAPFIVIRREIRIDKLLADRENNLLRGLIPHIQIDRGADIIRTDKFRKIHFDFFQTKHPLCRRIGKHQFAVLTEGNHAVTHVMQENFQTVFLS